MTSEEIDIEYQNAAKRMMAADKRYLESIIEKNDGSSFGPSALQRLFHIGYNRACLIIELGINEGLLVRGGIASLEHQVKVIPQ